MSGPAERPAYGVLPPSAEDVRRIGVELRLDLSEDDVEFFTEQAAGMIDGYRRVSQMVEPMPPVDHPRTPGWRPAPEDNPLNAWYWRCSVKGAGSGPLAGRKVALKDNICVAGVPMTSGSSLLEGYLPDFDATVVRRILDAGGEIVGKAVCEDHSMGAVSHNAFTGRVLNPHDTRYSAGGSSSGCGALVAAGAVDLAIGCDQGGSIRLPSSLCGVVGLKPTFGLVPYTGILPLDATLDHAGPMAATVADVATLLSVIAGPDPDDPRQQGVPAGQRDYASALTGSAQGLRVGILDEGFGWPDGSEAVVDDAVADAAAALAQVGATVHRVSVPAHRDSVDILTPVFVEGAAAQIGRGPAFGTGWRGFYPTSLIDAYGKARRASGRDLSDMVKCTFIVGQYMLAEYDGRFYAKAQNLARALRDAYDRALADVDVLVMPTTPRRANLHLQEADRAAFVSSAWWFHWNTGAFNMTGHPALSVPCAKADGLPIGMQLVGRPFEEETLLRAAHAFESLGRYERLTAARP